MPVQDLQRSPMMKHLLQALERGEDIGHYGRLVFVMVGQYFLSEGELIELLAKDPDCDEEKAAGILRQVKAHGYSPPKPDRILAWMSEQEFPICDTADHDKDTCNVYKSLKFPPEVYERIASYYQGSRKSS
jgi:DNA primase large subunit